MERYQSREERYLERFRRQAREAFLMAIPLTGVKWFPRSGNEGLYGYTYRQSGKIAMREDLKGNLEEKADTDIHESIHTSDEYETRRITEWILGFLDGTKKKYKGLSREYVI